MNSSCAWYKLFEIRRLIFHVGDPNVSNTYRANCVESARKQELVGITVETDDTEDGLVHCIKPGAVAANTAAAISAETATLIVGNEDDSDESDPLYK